MLNKKIIVDDFIPHNYSVMDFLVNIDINEYNQITRGDNLDQVSIMLNEELYSRKGVVLDTPITLDITFPINGDTKFEQIVFRPVILNRGDNFEEIIIKIDGAYIMEKNNISLIKYENNVKVFQEEQIP